ncbi:hypothetical protein [Sphingobacterium sp. DR205]|uniref:hypothetical protein n=1 Tax=Sphingobacterium sp. DR205 TaxID=2713573 RepID=UPI0013E43C3F|nr:hypothetical protein [Sphingobacterium sp. DR205]QIH36757.1 hypothetical protein G6053_29610 [Sphingobacterium sp. DR205]
MKKKTIFNKRSQLGVNSMILLSLVFLTTTFSLNAFSQKLTFTFDASGNQIKRVWVCINCPTLNVSNSESIASGDKLQADIIEIGSGYSLHLNRKKKIIQIHSEDLSHSIIPVLSLENFSDKRKVTINSFKKEDYVEFSTDKLSPGTYLLRISVGKDKWMELIIEKVKEA